MTTNRDAYEQKMLAMLRLSVQKRGPTLEEVKSVRQKNILPNHEDPTPTPYPLLLSLCCAVS